MTMRKLKSFFCVLFWCDLAHDKYRVVTRAETFSTGKIEYCTKCKREVESVSQEEGAW